MRSNYFTALSSLVLLAACGSDPTPGPTSDLAVPPPDATALRDLAALPDLASRPPDLATLPDLTRGPDLVTPPPGDVCGGFIGKPCPGGQFCDYPTGCGAADEQGVCRVPPQVCNKIYDPVCGCDGKVYDNDCFRQVAGTSLRNRGVCGCPQPCGPGSYCANCRNGPACVPNGAVC